MVRFDVEVNAGIADVVPLKLIAAIASGRLWRLARRQAEQSRTALALINAQLAVASGDVVVEDELVELVPTV